MHIVISVKEDRSKFLTLATVLLELNDDIFSFISIMRIDEIKGLKKIKGTNKYSLRNIFK